MQTASEIIQDIPPPAEPVDFDAIGAQFLRESIAADRKAYWHANTPPAMREDFDATRPELQSNAEQIQRVLSWQVGAKGLLASGPTGRAKTRAMFALCRRLLCEEARQVSIWHAQDFFSEMQACVRFGRDEANDFVKRQASRPVLFLDDYGQEAIAMNKQEWAQGWFFRLLDLRMSENLPLLITTNLTARDMAANAREVSSDPLLRRLLAVADPVRFN